ncbi:MAG: hypothetical protein WDO13_01940 [Verrucomicrobiota bacterium]
MTTPRQQETALLAALFAARGQRVARQELARLTSIAPGELDFRLTPYLQAGYPIEFHPQGDIGLPDPPDVWCAEEILARCPSTPGVPVWNPLLLAETTSTNDVVRDQARKEAAEGFLVAASRQTAAAAGWAAPGNRRPGAAFTSPSCCGPTCRPPRPAGSPSWAAWRPSTRSRRSVVCARGSSGPNDLVASGRKLGGLLIETELRRGRLAFAVLGIGLNVRHASADFSPRGARHGHLALPDHRAALPPRRPAGRAAARAGAAAGRPVRRGARGLDGKQPDAGPARRAGDHARPQARPGHGPR